MDWASLIGTGANIWFQNKTNQENIQQQWDMWNATNEYNHPAAQMNRYAEAGLNPNLIYGQSNTTSPVNVGVAEAPKASLQGLNPIADYLNLMSANEDLRTKELENELLSSTLQDRIRSYSLNNEKLTSDMSLTSKSIEKINSDIQRNGYLNTLDNLTAEIKRFEIEDFDRIRKIRNNDLKISNQSVINSKLINDNLFKEGQYISANTELAKFKIYLDQMSYTLLNAQTEHELKKMNLTDVEISKKYQEIENLKKQVDKMSTEINFISSGTFKNYASGASDIVKSLVGEGGLFKGGLSTFRTFSKFFKK